MSLTKTSFFDRLKNRTVKGVAALAGKTLLLQAISFLGFFLLSVFLNQAEIGLFFAVSEIVAILGYFSDVGLAAALIQKKGRLKKEDTQSTFAIQEGIVLALILVVLLLSPWLGKFYQIDSAGQWLLRSLLAGFFLASLKTIPSVILERRLRFDLLVIVEIIENFIFYAVSVLLAWQKLGVLSYAWAILLRGLAGVLLIYLLSPWPIGFSFRKKSLQRLLRFGIPYQANTILAVIKDRLMNVFLWKIIGASGVGILGWAQKWAQMPLRFAMDPVMRVTFPAFSRLQKRPKKLKQAIEFSLFLISALAFPLLIGLCLLARPLINLIPRYQKWLVALLPLYLFAFNAVWAAISTPITNAFNALGKIKITFKLMIFWTILTWVLTPVLALRYGYQGAALALGIIPVSSVIVFHLIRKQLGIRVGKQVFPPLLASVLMAALLFFTRPYLNSFPKIFAAALLGGLFYLGMLYALARAKFKKGYSLLKNAFFN